MAISSIGGNAGMMAGGGMHNMGNMNMNMGMQQMQPPMMGMTGMNMIPPPQQGCPQQAGMGVGGTTMGMGMGHMSAQQGGMTGFK